MKDGEELLHEPFQRLVEQEQLFAYKYDGFWAAMDTFKDKQMLDDIYATWASALASLEPFISTKTHTSGNQTERSNGDRSRCSETLKDLGLQKGSKKLMSRAKTQSMSEQSRRGRQGGRRNNGFFTGGNRDNRDESKNFVSSVLSC